MSAQAASDQILDRFFGGVNDADPASDLILIDLFRQSQASVLPYRRGSAERWYGFATDAQRARELQRQVVAFVGPSWTTWTGNAFSPDPREPIEGVISAVARGPMIRLEPLPGKDADVRSAFHLMAELLLKRPSVELREPRPRHRLLSELELAFAARNTARARELIDEIAEAGTLGAINLLFLDVRLRDVAGDTESILGDPNLPDLVRRRRPRAVTRAIVRAVQAQRLLPFEERWRGGDESAALAALDSFEELSTDFQAVFADTLLVGVSEFRPALVTHHLLRGEREEAEQLLEDVASDEAVWPRALIAASAYLQGSPIAPPLAPPDAMRAAFDAGAYDRVLERADENSINAEVIEYVVRAAYNLDTLSSAEHAIRILESASEEDLLLARADRGLREAEQALRALSFRASVAGVSEAVDSWQGWFTAVAVEPRFPAALSIAEHGRYEWSVAALSDKRTANELAEAIIRCANSGESGATAVGGLPHLLDWLDTALRPAEISPVLAAALDLLLYAADASDDRDDLSVRIFGQLAGIRQDVEEIASRLAEFTDLWNEVSAPMRLDWPLALLDVAVDFAGRAPAVKEFFAKILASVSLWRDRIDDSHEQVLRSLGDDLGEQAAVSAVLGPPPVDQIARDPLELALAERVVGVYSLTPGVRNRVVRLLAARCPTATVEVNADLVSTDQLRNLAEKADVMVVAFQSAKHAATDAIVAVRGRRNVVAAAGKGSAGVLRALEDWAVQASTT